jgi:predicted aspartyl protease
MRLDRRLLLVPAMLLASALPALAARRPAELRLPDGGHARFPFDLRGQHIWVRGTVNGDSAWIVIDTGASATVMDAGLAQKLGLRTVGTYQASGSAGSQPGTNVANVTVGLPGLVLRASTMNATDLSAFTLLAGHPMEVILGYELFRECVVRFDYPARMIDVWNRKHAPRDLGGSAVPMTLVHNHPYVEGAVTVAGHAPIAGRFVIDSGSGMAVAVTPEVVKQQNLLATQPRTLVAFGRGVGGEVQNHIGRAESFTLGDLKFDRPTLFMPDSSGGTIAAGGTLGNIGGQILERCRVTFDYARSTVRFEPGPGFARPFEADMLGATLQRGADGYAVRWVCPDSPASEAGIEAGDAVKSLDGQPFTSLDPAAVRERLRTEGVTVKLGLLHAGTPRDVTVKLRRLI